MMTILHTQPLDSSRSPGTRLTFIALSPLLFLGFSGTTLACTGNAGGGTYGNTINVPIEKREAPLGSTLSSGDWMVTGRGGNYFSGCAANERVAIAIRITGPLTYVTDISYGGRIYSAYQMTPTSPLYIFQHVTEIGAGVGSSLTETPVRNIDETINAGALPPTGNTDTRRATYMRYRVLGRGSLMTSTSQRITFHMSPVSYPSLVLSPSSNQKVNIPLPTCAFTDQTIRLDDIAATTLSAPGPSAYSKRFDISMDCNLAGKSLRLSMRDATTPGNTSTELAPTADSTAQGVRLQILRGSTPQAMNMSWNTPSVKGNITLELAARYYRLPGAFLSGSIGGKATLMVDYQ